MADYKSGSLPISEIEYDASVYPREKWHTSTVKEYADALKGGANFPPLVLEAETNRLLDGVHRWKAYQMYAEEYAQHEAQQALDESLRDGWAPPPEAVKVEWHTIPEGIPIKLYAASLSTTHGDRITTLERKALAREIFQENPDFTLEMLAAYLDVSKASAGEYVADIRARRREQLRTTAYRLHLLGWTQEEVAKTVGVSQNHYARDFLHHFPDLENGVKSLLTSGISILDVAERYNMPLILVWAIDLANRTDEQRMERLGIPVQPFDVWTFSKCYDLFGLKHPGRIPGQLVAHVLYFFTKPGAKVVDPMAGSGTTLDVCLAMGRECYAYDIDDRHGRPDIIKLNIAEDGWPDRLKKADLIFWDPPYFQKMDSLNVGDEGYIEGSISKMDRDAYLDFFTQRLAEARKVVKRGCKLAFLMSDWDDNTGERPGIFIWDYADVMRKAGWQMLRHIQAPLSTQQVHPDVVNKFRKSRRLARIERYLLIAEA